MREHDKTDIFIGSMIVLALLVLGVSAYLTTNYVKNLEANKNQIITNTDNPTATSSLKYINAVDGYSINFPASWNVEESEGVTRIYNPEKVGKAGTDSPGTMLLISINNSRCVSVDWTKGANNAYFKTKCIVGSKNTVQINSISLDDFDTVTESEIISSFKFR